MTYQSCQCCGGQLTENEVARGLSKCHYCDNHAHVLNSGGEGRTSCGEPTPKDPAPND